MRFRPANIAHNGGIKWSDEEIAALKRIYPVCGWEPIRDMFPWRTPHAISSRASRLGLKSPGRGNNGGGRKTPIVPHDCLVCGKPVPHFPGMIGSAYNRKRTCSTRCAWVLRTKSREAVDAGRKKGRTDDELVQALAARDRGDHSLLEAILNSQPRPRPEPTVGSPTSSGSSRR